jgi:hypothetical protein
MELMMQVLKKRAMDMEIITSCLVNGISNEKYIHRIYSTKNDYKNISGCGVVAYSVPFGLNFANKLNQSMYNKPLMGLY